MPAQLRIFCDFDGTIAKRDVGNLVFAHFGNENLWWQLVRQWQEGKLEGREMWRRQAETMRLTAVELDAFVKPLAIDASFAGLMAYVRERQIPLAVVSDGMDAYIGRILAAHGFADLPLRTNRMILASDGSVQLDFPWYGQGCDRCANCKGLHVRRERQPGETTVYIGDGPSDVCGAREADIVFAKKALLTWCRDNGRPHFPFATFADVLEQLHRLEAS
ncbi:MAG TPA: MtnX-like HAD-IB family phosphatase [bacterium]|nr:MtnX-like HAD-IB family phosphatase [bacterium]HPR88212.1 MtnX-like HAD-IB family phosphatase [bacterium]